jgi:hypothetical protein
MACSCPIPVWFAPPEGGEKAGRARGRILFNPRGADTSQPMSEVPCGKCRNCLRDRARDWGTRVACEAKMHGQSWMVTLTYADENLPLGGTLDPEHLSEFFRRVRTNIGRFKYLASGEYSDPPALRPHYHACLFGLDLPDMVPVGRSSRGHTLYSGPLLQAQWPHGLVNAGEVNAASGAYVASYILKGDGKACAEDYRRILHTHPTTGEIFNGFVHREFIRASLRPGIGATFVSKFADELLEHDFVIIEGERRGLPRYFDKLLERDHFDRFEVTKAARLDKALTRSDRELNRRFNGSREASYMHGQEYSQVMSRKVAIRNQERGE